jgi:uroporphyrinogen decarboxylase
MLTAMKGGIPDRVPVSPDISNMIPARLTGRPFWEIYLNDNPSLGDAYLDACDRFEIDGWYLYGHVKGGNTDFPISDEARTGLCYDTFFVPEELVSSRRDMSKSNRVDETIVVQTPLGELESTTICLENAPPWDISNFVKDIRRDWPRLKWLMGDSWHWDTTCAGKEKVGERAVYGLQVHTFVDFWDGVRDGQSDTMLFDFYDEPELMMGIFEFYQAFTLDRVKGLIDAGVDEILVQGSNSSMSLINPAIYRQYVLPLNIQISRITRDSGCIGHLHTCGKSSFVVDANMEHSTFDVVEPLEKHPSGDIDLADVKQRFGGQVALKGNLLTSGVLLHGTPEDVEDEVVETLIAAAKGGGFILSSGDQVGGNTPLENIEAMVTAGRKYGRYDEYGNLPDLPS